MAHLTMRIMRLVTMAMGGGGMGGTFIMSTCRITKLNMPMEGTARYLSRKVQRKDSLMLEKFCDLRYKYRRMGTIVSEDQVQACGRISQSSGFFGGDVVLHPTMALRGGGDGVSLDRQSSVSACPCLLCFSCIGRNRIRSKKTSPTWRGCVSLIRVPCLMVGRLIKEYEDAKEEWMAASLDDGEQSDELSDLDEAQKFVQESQMMDARLNQEMKKALAEFQELGRISPWTAVSLNSFCNSCQRKEVEGRNANDMNVPRIFDDSDSSCDPEKPRLLGCTSEDEWRMQRLKKAERCEPRKVNANEMGGGFMILADSLVKLVDLAK
eukprot:757606-Hanusia_phi.AAC.4